uniref:FHA domain-containing protein n=1 Tax=Macrostomum lignano TaxID=282301 RepID=A0A1I8JH66_9PLAT
IKIAEPAESDPVTRLSTYVSIASRLMVSGEAFCVFRKLGGNGRFALTGSSSLLVESASIPSIRDSPEQCIAHADEEAQSVSAILNLPIAKFALNGDWTIAAHCSNDVAVHQIIVAIGTNQDRYRLISIARVKWIRQIKTLEFWMSVAHRRCLSFIAGGVKERTDQNFGFAIRTDDETLSSRHDHCRIGVHDKGLTLRDCLVLAWYGHGCCATAVRWSYYFLLIYVPSSHFRHRRMRFARMGSQADARPKEFHEDALVDEPQDPETDADRSLEDVGTVEQIQTIPRAQASAEAERSRAEVSRLETRQAALEAERQRLQSAAASSAADWEAERRRLTEEAAQAREAKEAAERSAAEAEATRRSTEARLQRAVAEAAEEAAGLQAEVRALREGHERDGRLIELREALRRQERLADQLEAQLDEARSEAGAAERRLAETAAQLEAERERARGLERSAQQLQADKRGLQDRVSSALGDMTSERDRLDSAVGRLQTRRLAEAEAARDQLEAENAGLLERLRACGGDAGGGGGGSDVEGRLRELTEGRQRLAFERGRLQTQVEQLQERLDRAGNAEAAAASLRVQLAAAEAQAREAGEAGARLRAEVADLRGQVRQLRDSEGRQRNLLDDAGAGREEAVTEAARLLAHCAAVEERERRRVTAAETLVAEAREAARRAQEQPLNPRAAGGRCPIAGVGPGGSAGGGAGGPRAPGDGTCRPTALRSRAAGSHHGTSGRPRAAGRRAARRRRSGARRRRAELLRRQLQELRAERARAAAAAEAAAAENARLRQALRSMRSTVEAEKSAAERAAEAKLQEQQLHERAEQVALVALPCRYWVPGEAAVTREGHGGSPDVSAREAQEKLPELDSALPDKALHQIPERAGRRSCHNGRDVISIPDFEDGVGSGVTQKSVHDQVPERR